nr:MAG TPA: central spike protein [Caudoviricetes sp.]
MDKSYNVAMIATDVMHRIGDPTKEVPIRKKYKASVVENKHQGDGNKVLFHLEELVPLSRGHLKDNPIPMKRVYQDSNGRVFTARGTHNNNFIAEYYSTNSFRKSPPDVQRGEIINVWQKADTDDWFWEDTSEDNLAKRRLETIIHGVNADKRVGYDPGRFDDDNTYFTEMSSHNRTYTISTSEANDEVAAYKMQINAGEGSVVTQDNVGNHFQIDTKGTEIWLHNANGTEVKLTRDCIWVFCRDKMEVQVGGNAIIHVKGNTEIKVQGNSDIQVQGNSNIGVKGNSDISVEGNSGINVKGDSSINVEGNSSLGVKGNSNIEVSGDTSLKTPTFNIKANVNIEGNLNQKGNFSASGTVAAEGNISSKATIQGGDGSSIGSNGADIKGPLKASGPVSFPAGGDIKGYD